MENNKIKDAMIHFISTYYEEQETQREQSYVVAPDETYKKIIDMGIPEEGHPLEEMVCVLKEDVFPYRLAGENPKSLAFVPAPVEEVSKLGDLITTMYNPNAAGWFSAPIVAQIHQQMIEWFTKKVGFDERAGGVFVSGGSLANLTCIIAARDNKLPMDKIIKGVAYVSEQAHHSVNKALRMIGIPDERVHRVATGKDMKMKPEVLDRMIQEDVKEGFVPFMVIGTAGTTNTGTIDPLKELAKVAHRHELWFHVDGAFGASVLASNQNHHLLKGIEEADSVIWDAHKWLYQTYTCAVALVKDQSTLLNSFSDNPSYLKDAATSKINSWDLGPELSRPALGVKLWLTLQTLGTKKIGENIDYSISLAKEIEQIIEVLPQWEIVTKASLAMVSFAFVDAHKTQEELNELHRDICHEITNSGFATVLTTELEGRTVIRICTISPQATRAGMEEVIGRLNEYAKNWERKI